MCCPRKEKINWQEDLPPELVPPPAEMDLDLMPQLNMIPFVNVQMLGEVLSDSDDSLSSSESVTVNANVPEEEGMQGDPLESSEKDIVTSDSESEDMQIDPVEKSKEDISEPLVISFCMNDPKIVWPSDTDSSSESEGDFQGENDSTPAGESNKSAYVGQNECSCCGDKMETGDVSYSTGTNHSCPVWFLERGRGQGRRAGAHRRNFARRSRPFFGKQN